ncbi:MAG: FAD-dependent thymidylate synthase [Caedibacter sp. 38-128]|nr:FAD-dependent thymidylate synthase [Holosporales bacterium]OJX07041.1 MAG: FAD-dependent thymidylate synthase [Caedibacter sp. 38-128]
MSLNQAKRDEISDILQQTASTRRATVPALEEILYQPFPVLDHGFVRVIDYMGDDTAIVQSARVSYGKGTKQIQQDKGLINYLMRHRHSTPFEMCEIKYHIKLPIFVARQWIRHRTANVNEYSARYSILGKEYYIPRAEDLSTQSITNRQGRGSSMSPEEAAKILNLLRKDAELVYEHYEDMLNQDQEGNILDPNRSGLTRELARMNLTLNYYTEWYWKIDLHNLLHFTSLRGDPHAQYEIRAYVNVLLDTIKKWVPFAHDAFVEYRLEGAHISRTGRLILKRLLQGEKVTQLTSGLSQREWKEFIALFDLHYLENSAS